MKAVGYYHALPISQEESLVDLELPKPKATGKDILVKVEAIAVNPIDVKVRQRVEPTAGAATILGWDASGIVTEVGPEVSLFKVGDAVWYAGDIKRPGANCEYHLVHEELAANKPQSLDFLAAAALPLTSITAWELLFDRLQIPADSKGSLLVTAAAGGVGSILVQLAKQLTSLTIIGTASRPESQQWVRDLGADHVIDHRYNLAEQLPVPEVDYVISLSHTDDYLSQLVNILKPQGKFALIDEPKQFNVLLFKPKSLSIHWESMFTRSGFATLDRKKQHEILAKVAALVDKGLIKSTMAESLGSLNASNLRQAHALIESGKSVGKVVLSGFNPSPQ